MSNPLQWYVTRFFWPFFVYFLLFFVILGDFNMFGCIWMLHGIREHMKKWAGNFNNLNWYIVSIFLHIFCLLLILFSDSTRFSRVWKHSDITGCRRGWSVSPTICIGHYFTILVVILYIIINIIFCVLPVRVSAGNPTPMTEGRVSCGYGCGSPKIYPRVTRAHYYFQTLLRCLHFYLISLHSNAIVTCGFTCVLIMS